MWESPLTAPRGAIESLARYMSRAALSVDRIHYHAEEQTVTVDAGKSQAGSRNWPVPEFFALLDAHIPCRYEGRITYKCLQKQSSRHV